MVHCTRHTLDTVYGALKVEFALETPETVQEMLGLLEPKRNCTLYEGGDEAYP